MAGADERLDQMSLVIVMQHDWQPLQLSLPTATGSSSPSPYRAVSILVCDPQNEHEGWSSRIYMSTLFSSLYLCQTYVMRPIMRSDIWLTDIPRKWYFFPFPHLLARRSSGYHGRQHRSQQRKLAWAAWYVEVDCEIRM
jgi:hypothetical protein